MVEHPSLCHNNNRRTESTKRNTTQEREEQLFVCNTEPLHFGSFQGNERDAWSVRCYPHCFPHPSILIHPSLALSSSFLCTLSDSVTGALSCHLSLHRNTSPQLSSSTVLYQASPHSQPPTKQSSGTFLCPISTCASLPPPPLCRLLRP